MKTFNLPEHEINIYNKSKTFLIIGAFDGESHDNFFHNILQKKEKSDNRIVFVEPVVKYFNELLIRTKNLIDFNVVCINEAISDKKEEVEIVSVKPNLTSKYGWFIEGCACVVENKQPINIYMKDVEISDIDSQIVNTITFEELVEKTNLSNLDFLQIDTEGYDQRIINSIDFKKYNIGFIKFEKHYLSEGFIETFIDKLSPLDYSYYWDNDNYYFVKNLIING